MHQWERFTGTRCNGRVLQLEGPSVPGMYLLHLQDPEQGSLTLRVVLGRARNLDTG